MKRILILLLCIVSTITIYANPPKLNVEKLFDGRIEKDAPRGSDYSDYQGNDGQYTSLQIVNNGETIYIGLQRDKSGGGFFFIQGKEKAFQ